MQPPDVIYQELFTDVQLSGVFPDSKTFVDSIPQSDPDEILKRYRHEKKAPGFSLHDFVLKNFLMPPTYSSGFESDTSRPIEEHIESLWKVLRREPDSAVPGSTLIPLPHPYIVPGGRFGEIYYWDSYFTLLGLLESGHKEIALHMVSNFAYLVDTIGHIPNGNRTYFLSRSQPPFFALMVNEVARETHHYALYANYAPKVEKEYRFWMHDDSSTKKYPHAHRRVVKLGKEVVLNRYWDDSDQPRQESYREDVELAKNSSRNPQELYRDLRAACESGWDFSTRWLAHPDQLDSIMTTHILPADLNCLLWTMEHFLSLTYEGTGEKDKAEHYAIAAERRKEWIHRIFWNESEKAFMDYDFKKDKHTNVISLAMMYPLFVGIASQDQANKTVETLQDFIRPGGLVTTLHHSGQQWDAPNGWAPLQWIAFEGLCNYGFYDLAMNIASGWIDNVKRIFQSTGKMLEKYNVEDITLPAGGGEYPVQDGFGWTNGVFLKLLRKQ